MFPHRSAALSQTQPVTTRAALVPSLSFSDLTQRLEGKYAATVARAFPKPPVPLQQNLVGRGSQNSEDMMRTAVQSSQSQFERSTPSQVPVFESNTSLLLAERDKNARLQQSLEELVKEQKETNRLLATISKAMEHALTSSSCYHGDSTGRTTLLVASKQVQTGDLEEFDLYSTVVSAEELVERARELKKTRRGSEV